jgi:hypothetical protein
MENHPGRNQKRNSEKFVITFKDRYFGSATLEIMSLSIMIQRHHDIQNIDNQHNDIQHKDLICDTQNKRHSALQHFV